MSQKIRSLSVNEPLKSTQLDPKFKYEVAKEPGGEGLGYCFQCGKCTATCPIRRVESIYKPRQILRAALLGLREIVLSSDVIWLCAKCHKNRHSRARQSNRSINIRIPKSLHSEIKVIAFTDGVSMSEWIKQSLTEAMRHE